MKYIRYIFLLILIVCARTASGQDYTSSDKKAVRLYEKAMTALQQGNGTEAERALRQAIETDDAFLEAHLTLAEWLLDSKREAEAASHYRTVVQKDATFFSSAWLQLAQIELSQGDYDRAESDFARFLEFDKRDKRRHAEAERGIATARFRREAMAHPVDFRPVNLGPAVNSADDEYLPALTVDGETMVFTRRFPRRPTTTADTREEEDLYTSSFRNGQWTAAVRMPEPLNTGDNEGAECISQDGRIMFFTACGRRDGGGRCDLYMCVNKNGQWGKPRNLGPQVNSGAWEGQPTFSVDGKTLYFVSDRKGGQGGMDIWKTVYENGRWSDPVNLGPDINTAGNEMSPFIHYDDQTLYFASDGHIGLGGMDIFVSRLQADGSWGVPQNLGYPVNTQADESNLIVDASSATAYYSSDRAGGLGKQDLYSFTMPTASRPVLTNCFRGSVSNSKTGAPVAADIRVVRLSDGEVVANTSSDATVGSYQVSLPQGHDYAFLVSADGYLFYSQNVESGSVGTDDGKWMPVTVDISLQPIEKGSRLALRNVFFESGRHEILPASEYELQKLADMLKQNPELRIELGGHTDNVGSAEANQQLSERRAKAVYDYLTNKGIPADRLSYKGYGETQPVATNDTEEGRGENRRTEIKVM